MTSNDSNERELAHPDVRQDEGGIESAIADADSAGKETVTQAETLPIQRLRHPSG